jgi:hypothetical protein
MRREDVALTVNGVRRVIQLWLTKLGNRLAGALEGKLSQAK